MCLVFLARPGVSALAALLALLVLGCNGDVVEVGSDTAARRCLSHAMYLVNGDEFTLLTAALQTIDGTGQGRVSPGYQGNDREPRAKAYMGLFKLEGEAQLLWNGAAVSSFTLDEPFLLSDGLALLEYTDPDGTLVEYHVWARATCTIVTGSVLTRAEIAALEQ